MGTAEEVTAAGRRGAAHCARARAAAPPRRAAQVPPGGRWAAPALPAGGVLRGGPGRRVCAQPALLQLLVFRLVVCLFKVLLVNFAVMGVP